MGSTSILLSFCLLTYDAVDSKMEVIPERAEIVGSTYVEGRYNFSRCRITRFNQTTYGFETEFELMVDLGSDYSFELSYHYNRLSNNQYTRMPFQLPKMSLCLLFDLYYKPYMMENVKDISNFPQCKSNESVCPFKKGRYWLKNFTLDPNKLPASLPFDGHWKGEATIIYKGEVFFAGNIYFQLIRSKYGWDV